MPITPGTQRIDLNGVTAVTVVSNPGAAIYRIVLVLRVFNLDTAIVDVTLQKNVSATKKTLEKVVGLVVNGVWRPIDRDHVIILAPTTDTLELFMGGAAATTNPHAEVEYIDKS